MKKWLLDKIQKRFDSGYVFLQLKDKYEKHAKSWGGVTRFVLWLQHKRMMRQYGAFIPLNTDMGKDVCFPHGINGIFISQGAHIGEGCTIFHHVTIGSNLLKDSKHYGAPYIGNNVYIGAGAKIIGGIKIGDNARIGAGCVVTRDVPDGATVVMPAPVVIMHNEKRDNKFENFSETKGE